MTRLSRRDLLRAGVGGAGLITFGAATGCAPLYVPPSNGSAFSLGVVSGLHAPDAVVLWTRLDPALASGRTDVTWKVATDAAMTNVVRSGSASADPSRDHTVKVLADGLQPDRSYWYRFEVDGNPSPVGRARTTPLADASVSSLRLATASCQNWGQGWYHAWASIAADDVDAVLWLGDYIYESVTPGPLAVRDDPIGMSRTLEQYWAKYRLYRSDPNLQAGHAAHPLVPIWDDHEFVNDCNRHTNEAFPERARAAYQAWFDYMPVWPIDGTRIYRSIRWGDLAVIAMLDSRQYRDHPANGFAGVGVEPLVGLGEVIRESNLEGRSMLGHAQRGWLVDTIDEADEQGVRWKLLGNQLMMTPTRAIDLDDPALRSLFPDLTRNDGLYINLDSWNSYLWERQYLLDHWHQRRIPGITVLTGDVHSFWTARQRIDPEDRFSPVVASEYVTGSVSSTTPNILGTDEFASFLEQGPINWTPQFDYVNFRDHGYGLVDVSRDRLEVRYRTTRAREQYFGVYDNVRFTENFERNS